VCAAVDAIPIQKLLGTDASGRNAAMVRMGDDYFNSGVILFNVKRWKELNSERNWKKIYSEYQRLGFQYADQCLLNFICFDSFHHLDAKYNVYATIRREYVRKNEIKILHFPGRDKPWTFHKYSLSIFLSSVNVRFFLEYFKIQKEMINSVRNIDPALAIHLQNLNEILLKKRSIGYLLNIINRKVVGDRVANS
jgi:lipopolysaccharide biosynthesis glycosyltransferase